MLSGCIERTIPVHTAIEMAKAMCLEHGLIIEMDEYGDELKTTVCNLRTKSGKTYAGKGKGLGEQSVASALFEAIEHYFYHIDKSLNAGICAPLRLSQSDSPLSEGSPNFELFPGVTDIPLSRVSYTELLGNRLLEYPAFLTNPEFVSNNSHEEQFLKTTRVRRYSTNSGTASGTCLDEAILHALLELIERDALGLELLRTVFRSSPEPVRIVDLTTLPESILSVCKLAERETNATIRLFDLGTDIGVPAFLVELRVKNVINSGYFGSGASLSIEYAIERATLEAVQGFHVYKHMFDRKPIEKPSHTNRLTKFQSCLLEYGIFDYRGGETNLTFEELLETYTQTAYCSPSQQIDLLVRKLGACGVDAYSRVIHEGKVFICQVVAPKLERFFLISEGLVLAPGGRGRSVIGASKTHNE